MGHKSQTCDKRRALFEKAKLAGELEVGDFDHWVLTAEEGLLERQTAGEAGCDAGAESSPARVAPAPPVPPALGAAHGRAAPAGGPPVRLPCGSLHASAAGCGGPVAPSAAAYHASSASPCIFT